MASVLEANVTEPHFCAELKEILGIVTSVPLITVALAYHLVFPASTLPIEIEPAYDFFFVTRCSENFTVEAFDLGSVIVTWPLMMFAKELEPVEVTASSFAPVGAP